MSCRQGFAARVAAGCVVVAIVSSDPCRAQARFQRISVSDSGAEANGNLGSTGVRLTPDGRHVGFDTFASNLSPWDINTVADVFVRDRADGATILISAALTGLTGNNSSAFHAITPDGRFVVFSSDAYDLIRFDTNNQRDVFVRDRDPDANGILDEGNETTVRVSVDSAGLAANGASTGGAISDDGTKVAFQSDADNLAAGDGNGATDVFVRDLVAGTTTLVSVAALGASGDAASFDPAITADGTRVMFTSTADDLVAGDLNGANDVFVRDLGAGTTDRVSLGWNGNETNGAARDFRMSADGTKLVWSSDADDVVASDLNNKSDVFLRDLAAGTTVCLSVSESGEQGDRGADHPALSRNGAWASFNSNARNLEGIETNFTTDVFLRDLVAGTMTKASTRPCGAEGAGASSGYDVSDDGLTVALLHNGTDLIGGDANGIFDLLVRDRTQPDIFAWWQNYGAGWPGTNGIPTFTPTANPVMGSSIDGLVDNSLGFWTVGFFFFGLSPLSVPTALGGDFLVDPILSMVFLVPPGGLAISADVPLDDAIVGIHYYAQVLLIDDGASEGVSFTPGLELIAGQ